MLRRLGTKRFLQIGCAVLFAVLSIGIQFFHTENSSAGQVGCPACHFLASSHSVGPAVVFLLFLLISLGIVRVELATRPSSAEIRLSLTRSPPSA